MSAIEALAAAKAARIKLTLDGDGIVLEIKTPPLPADVVALLRSVKPDLMRILEWREAARAVALSRAPPEDCGHLRPVVGVWRWTTCDEHGRETSHARTLHGPPESRWALAMQGLKHFVLKGWGDQACLLGWGKNAMAVEETP